MLSRLSTTQSMALMRWEPSCDMSPSDMWVRNCEISISMRSVISSYFSMRFSVASNSSSSLAVRSAGRNVYMRSTRFENSAISRSAAWMFSSGVLVQLPPMYFRR